MNKQPFSLRYGRIIILLLMIVIISVINYNYSNKESCKKPKVMIGGNCCITSKNNPYICKEEAEMLNRKTQEVVENNKVISAGEKLLFKEPSFYFNPPVDYYLVEDLTIAGLKVPYYFFKMDNDKAICFIKVTITSQEDLPDKGITSLTEYITGGFQNESLYNIIKQGSFVNYKGAHAYYIEAGFPNNNKIKFVYFEDRVQKKLTVFTFTCLNNHYYNKEILNFEEVISSFSFS